VRQVAAEQRGRRGHVHRGAERQRAERARQLAHQREGRVAHRRRREPRRRPAQHRPRDDGALKVVAAQEGRREPQREGVQVRRPQPAQRAVVHRPGLARRADQAALRARRLDVDALDQRAGGLEGQREGRAHGGGRAVHEHRAGAVRPGGDRAREH